MANPQTKVWHAPVRIRLTPQRSLKVIKILMGVTSEPKGRRSQYKYENIERYNKENIEASPMPRVEWKKALCPLKDIDGCGGNARMVLSSMSVVRFCKGQLFDSVPMVVVEAIRQFKNFGGCGGIRRLRAMTRKGKALYVAYQMDASCRYSILPSVNLKILNFSFLKIPHLLWIII